MGPEKRLPLALFLCFVILFGWQLLTAEVETSPAGGADANESATPLLEDGGNAADAATTPTDTDTVTPDGAPETTAASTADDDSGDDDSGEGGSEPEPSVPAWDGWIEFGTPGSRGHLVAHFDSMGGSLAELRLGGYYTEHSLDDAAKADRENQVRLVEPTIERDRRLQALMLRPGVSANELLESQIAEVHWEHELLPGNAGVRFTHRDASGVTLVKTIRHVPDQYQLEVELVTTTTSESSARRRATLGLVASVGMKAESGDAYYSEPKAVGGRTGKDPEERDPDTDGSPRMEALVTGDVAYFGTHNKYFAMLMRPADDRTRAVLREADWEAVFDPEWVMSGGDTAKGFQDVLVEGVLELTIPSVGDESRQSFVIYAGPKNADSFGPGDEAYNDILREDLGFFDGIAGVILGFLRFLHGIVGNWGVAIILLTLTVRGLLFPLNRRMQTAMARHATKMKRVQPKINAIKKKYENNPQKLRQEQARIFQEEGAMPPLGGCLPIFIQIPVFFGLFSALRVAFDLRQQPFVGWIKDLSQPDHLARIDLPVPLIGPIEYLNILPILMVVLWVGQQRVMPRPQVQDEQQKQMQKIMMWMPIMFGFFLYGYAAGLSLYMITSSAFGIIEYTVIRKIWPIDDTEQPKKKSRFMERLEEMQKQALAQQEAQRNAKGGGKR